jgi:hypothetical protein
LPLNGKTFPEHRRAATSREAFKQRLAQALARRLHPNSGLTRKALAHAIGRSPETIENYLSGYSQPDSHAMGELMAFLDAGFACEVYGPHGLVVIKADDLGKARGVLSHMHSLAPALETVEQLLSLAVP